LFLSRRRAHPCPWLSPLRRRPALAGSSDKIDDPDFIVGSVPQSPAGAGPEVGRPDNVSGPGPCQVKLGGLYLASRSNPL